MADELPDFEGGANRRIESIPVIVPEVRLPRRGYTMTPGASALDPAVKGVWVNQACDVMVSDADDNSLTFTMESAGFAPIVPIKVTAISEGTVIGLYD